MAYNGSALIDIDQLAMLAQRGAAAEKEIADIKDELAGIVAEGGEPNKIDSIKVNGVTQIITDKVVDISVPTKTSDLTNDSEFATVADVSEAVAKIVANAPEDFNTLKEIADWIENHADSAAEMNKEIHDNADAIDELEKLIGKLPEETQATTVIQYIQELVAENTYVHPTHTAYANGFYKVTVDGEGHVTLCTAVAKDDITALGIPAQDTTYDIATDAEVEEMLEEVFGG